jgi:hypothetical protein
MIVLVGDPFEELGRLFLAEPELRRHVVGLDRETFVARLVELACSRGLAVNPADVEQALRDARRQWPERWI